MIDNKDLLIFSTPVVKIEFKNFEAFIEYCWGLIKEHYPEIQYQAATPMPKDTGDIFYRTSVQDKKSALEFFKEGNFEWYLGGDQDPLAVYYVDIKSFQKSENFESRLKQDLRV